MLRLRQEAMFAQSPKKKSHVVLQNLSAELDAEVVELFVELLGDFASAIHN